MPVDLDEQLTGQLATVAQQGVADNQRLAQNTLLAYQKDEFQGGQGEAGVIFGSMSTSDRAPVIKTVGGQAKP